MATNDISLFHSSVSTVDGNVHQNDTNDESMILAQLNELRLWQETQRKTLAESQLDQQKMLQLEKQKLYAMFGLSADESSLQDVGACSLESSHVLLNNQQHPTPTPPLIKSPPKTPSIENKPLLTPKSLELNSPSMTQLQKIIENLAVHSPKHDINALAEDTADIPKRPYLKRGEGLKNRFKVDPNAFRLDNLPKYKYARRMQKHAQSQPSRKQRHQEITTNDTLASLNADVGVDETIEGQQNNANDDGHKQNTSENNRKLRKPVKRPNPHKLSLKPNKITQSTGNSSSTSNDVNKLQHHRKHGKYIRFKWFLFYFF